MKRKLITAILIFIFVLSCTNAWALRTRSANDTPVAKGMAGAMHEGAGANRLSKAEAGMESIIAAWRKWAIEKGVIQESANQPVTEPSSTTKQILCRSELVKGIHKEIADVAETENLTAEEKVELTNWTAQKLGQDFYGMEIQLNKPDAGGASVAKPAQVDDFEYKVEIGRLFWIGLKRNALVDDYLKKAGRLDKNMYWGSELLNYYRSHRYQQENHPINREEAFRCALIILLLENDATCSAGAKWIIEQEFIDRERGYILWKEYYRSMKNLASPAASKRLEELEPAFIRIVNDIKLVDGETGQGGQRIEDSVRFSQARVKNRNVGISGAMHESAGPSTTLPSASSGLRRAGNLTPASAVRSLFGVIEETKTLPELLALVYSPQASDSVETLKLISDIAKVLAGTDKDIRIIVSYENYKQKDKIDQALHFLTDKERARISVDYLPKVKIAIRNLMQAGYTVRYFRTNDENDKPINIQGVEDNILPGITKEAITAEFEQEFKEKIEALIKA